MSVWSTLVDEQAIRELVSDDYARYAAPVAAALAHFLEMLPEQRQREILVVQAALPATAAAEERLGALARQSPALHKLGQVLARDHRLVPELRHHLQQLESLPPMTPATTLRRTIEAELGPLAGQGVILAGEALAEASVAVVIPFCRERAACRVEEPEQGVFKVLKPGIEERLGEDLEALDGVGTFLDERCDHYGLPPLDYRDTFAQVRDRLDAEIRLDEEQEHLARARAEYAGVPGVLVPRVLPFGTHRITAMERVFGRGVIEYARAGTSPADRGTLAARIAEVVVAQPVWSPAEKVLVHGDPHAGNLFVTDDGRLALLDWSLAAVLGSRERIEVGQVLLGALTLDPAAICRALAALADRVGDPSGLGRVAAAAVGRIVRGQLPGFAWLTDLLDDAAREARLRVSADLVLFRKALLSLEGVVADVSEPGRLDSELSLAFLRRLACEWPWRLRSPAGSRAFGTRLSSADLGYVAASLPWTAARYALEAARPDPCTR